MTEQKLFSDNEQAAEELRSTLQLTGTLALKLVGSPGAGKSAFLERTLQNLPPGTNAAVLSADRRLARYGVPARRLDTVGGSHLRGWDLKKLDLLFIESAGNTGDLGEDASVVVLSVTEGEDTPLKYPGIFRRAEVMILNKIDLLPDSRCRADLACENAWSIQPELEIIQASSLSGAGFREWMEWLAARMAAKTFVPPQFGLQTSLQTGLYRAV